MGTSTHWPSELAAPVDPLEHTVRARAQSILTRGGKVPPLLPYAEALAVVQQHESSLQKQGASPVNIAGRFIQRFTNRKEMQQ